MSVRAAHPPWRDEPSPAVTGTRLMADAPSRRLWITRAQPQAEATARRVAALGWTPVTAPVLQIRPLTVEPGALAGADSLAFTSQAAVAAFVAQSSQRELRVFAVGAATARAAAQAGFTHIEEPGAQALGVEALADHIARAQPRPAMVLHLAARHPAGDLSALLAERGLSAHAVAVYDAVPTALAHAPEAIDGVMVHSPRTAQQVARILNPETARGLCLWAISTATAEPLRKLGFKRIFVAERPHERAMLTQLQD